VRGRAGRLRWRLDLRARFWVFFLLFCWAYLELSASAILAPPGHTTAVVRLYNLMHYGRSQVLSAMVLAALLVPLLVVLIVETFRSSAVRLVTHG
jgi:ABC-type Fe3+ transport system permease subunit